MILFFMSLFKFLLNNSFLWLKAFLAIPILVWISVSHLPSLVMRAPRYLNRSTCSGIYPSIVMFITPSPFLDTFHDLWFSLYSTSCHIPLPFCSVHPSAFVNLLQILQPFHGHLRSAHLTLAFLRP